MAQAGLTTATAPHFCLQEKVMELLNAAWKAPTAEAEPRTLNIADVLHLAVNLQDSTPAAAILNEVKQLRSQLVNQQLSELLQQQKALQAQEEGLVKAEQQALALAAVAAAKAQQLQQRLQEFDGQVNAAELEQLLATALARSHIKVMKQLCALPAAAHVPDAAVNQLIEACLELKAHTPSIPAGLQHLVQWATRRSAEADSACNGRAAAVHIAKS
jgi:hypothetical protein